MVKTGHTPIKVVDFDSRLHARLPVEVIETDQLLTRMGRRGLAAPQRPSFHALLLMRSRRGSHTVDFADIPAQPGRLLQIRPGQVHIWNTETALDASLVLAQGRIGTARLWFPGHAPYSDLTDEAIATAEALIDVLRRQQASFDGAEATSRLMTAEFAALLALFDQASVETSESHVPEVYVAFRAAVEAELTHRHHIVDYADRLGYSARTITRACKQVAGQSAKRLLTDRLLLEAKRLLVHTDLPAAAIASRLGFSEATNFSTFFTREAGVSPTTFRRGPEQIHGRGAGSET